MGFTYADDGKRDSLPEKRGGISGSTVKLIGIAAMLIDHIAASVLARILVSGGWNRQLYSVYSIMRDIGRLGFPIFCFLLVEGVGRTRSKTKYALRLGLFALISEIPFDLAFSAKVLEFGYQNVFFTLFFGMLALCAYEFVSSHRLPVGVRLVLYAAGTVLTGLFLREKWPARFVFGGRHQDVLLLVAACAGLFFLPLLYAMVQTKRKLSEAWLNAGADLAALGVCMWAAHLLKTDYAGMGVLAITAMYLFRKSNVLAMTGGCVVLTAMSFNELPAFFAVVPAGLYNGKRGWKLKYFFYAFYPAHLFLLWAVSALMGLGNVPVA